MYVGILKNKNVYKLHCVTFTVTPQDTHNVYCRNQFWNASTGTLEYPQQNYYLLSTFQKHF